MLTLSSKCKVTKLPLYNHKSSNILESQIDQQDSYPCRLKVFQVSKSASRFVDCHKICESANLPAEMGGKTVRFSDCHQICQSANLPAEMGWGGVNLLADSPNLPAEMWGIFQQIHQICQQKWGVTLLAVSPNLPVSNSASRNGGVNLHQICQQKWGVNLLAVSPNLPAEIEGINLLADSPNLPVIKSTSSNGGG